MTKPKEFKPTSEYKLALCDIWLFEKGEGEPILPDYFKVRLKNLLEKLIPEPDEALPIASSSVKSTTFFDSEFFISEDKVYSYKSVRSYGLDELLLMQDDGVFLAALKLRQAKYWSDEKLRYYIYEYINIDNEDNDDAMVFIDDLVMRYSLILPDNVRDFTSGAIEWRKQHGTQKQHDEICEYFYRVAEENKKEFEVKPIPEESHFSKKGKIKLPLIEVELFEDGIIDKQYNWMLKSAHKKGTPSIIPYLALFVHKLDEYGYFKQQRKNSKMASLFSQRYNLSENEEKSLVNALKPNKLESIGKQVKMDIELCFDRINKKHLIV